MVLQVCHFHQSQESTCCHYLEDYYLDCLVCRDETPSDKVFLATWALRSVTGLGEWVDFTSPVPH